MSLLPRDRQRGRPVVDPDHRSRFRRRRGKLVGGWQERVLSAGTEWETTAYRFDADRSGPTAVVLAGQHGIEPEGWEAAEQLLEYEPDRGTLVVLPRADPSAIRIGRYTGTLGGDTNSLWPTGRRPAHRHVRAMWDTIAEVDPDVVIDLHSSQGIYKGSPSGVGQATFPTPDGWDTAARVNARLNRDFITGEYPGKFRFRRGNRLSGSGTKLARKARADLGAMAFIFETARVSPLRFPARREMTLAAARYLLEESVGMQTSR